MAMQSANETTEGALPNQPPTKDWRKFVTLDPVSHLTFKPREGDRPATNLRLINKGDLPIMFKVKTTKPARYLVRPSQGLIGHNNEVLVTVLFTQALDGPVSTNYVYNLSLMVCDRMRMML